MRLRFLQQCTGLLQQHAERASVQVPGMDKTNRRDGRTCTRGWCSSAKGCGRDAPRLLFHGICGKLGTDISHWAYMQQSAQQTHKTE